ncbi:MAG: AAA family ATPase [Pseudomonadota bacterium]
MYEAFFGLTERPFSIAPDPRFVYLSPAHEEALAHLVYGVRESGGFVLLTGEVGTGKTTLVRTLLEEMVEEVDLALVLNPKLSPLEFVATVCDELEIGYDADTTSLKHLVDCLNAHLLETYAQGRRTVLIIDEAQGLATEVLEQIRLLTNLETTREKLLEIVLVGQPELRNTLERSDLRQLSQRITARYHLEPLGREDTRGYVVHRLRVVGGSPNLFSRGALARLYRLTGGVPRLINEIADRAMLGAYAAEKPVISAGMVSAAARQVLGSPLSVPRRRRLAVTAAALAGIVMVIGLAVRNLDMPALMEEHVRERPAEPGDDRPVVIVQAPSVEMPPHPPAVEAAPLARTPEAATAGQPLSPSEPVEQEGELTGVKSLVLMPASEAVTSSGDLAEWVRRQGDRLSTRSAFAAVFQSWGLGSLPPAAVSPCDQAEDQGLRCLQEEGDMTDLTAINLPTVIPLRGEDGGWRDVAVLAFDRENVVLGFDDQRASFPRTELDTAWRRGFVVLWRPPVEVPDLLVGPGDHGEAVLWVRERLQQITGQEIGGDDPLAYDERLERMVRMFQMFNRLEPDGIVGERTLLRLNTAPTVGARSHPMTAG